MHNPLSDFFDKLLIYMVGTAGFEPTTSTVVTHRVRCKFGNLFVPKHGEGEPRYRPWWRVGSL